MALITLSLLALMLAISYLDPGWYNLRETRSVEEGGWSLKKSGGSQGRCAARDMR